MSDNRNPGGIWERKINGKDALSISIEIKGVKYNFLAFRNNAKETGDKRPDWNILPSRERQ